METLQEIWNVLQGCFALLIITFVILVSLTLAVIFPILGKLFFWNKFLGGFLFNLFFEKRIKLWWRSKRGARKAFRRRMWQRARDGVRNGFEAIGRMLPF